MRYIKTLLIACTAILFAASCNKDKSPDIEVDQIALYFNDWGTSAQVVSFSTTNAVRVSVTSISEGFDYFIDDIAHKIVVTPTGNKDGSNDNLSKEGYLRVNAISKDGDIAGQTIYLYICEEMKLDENQQYANSYIVTKPNVKCTFEANVRPDGTPLETEYVELLWQSGTGVIENVNYFNNNVTFFITSSDDDYNKVPNENGVIAAYNEDDDIIWSWHIWITDTNPAQEVATYSNGKTFMVRNLGAFTNSEASHDTEKIYNSYGLYYQWGRKDPFLRPQTYTCSGGKGEIIYNNLDYYYSEETFVETSPWVGTAEYATEYPMDYITNAECIEEGGDGIGDWLATADNNRWSDNEKNLLNDPCPYGWKVPSASDFEVLRLTDTEDQTDLNDARKRYGWWLSDGVNNFFYNACGYRRYNDGKIENMNYHESYPSTPEPWEGHYWTSTANNDGSAVSLYFDLTTTRTINKFQNDKPSRRANGMQIRCVRVE